jgi:hypothetical protein
LRRPKAACDDRKRSRLMTIKINSSFLRPALQTPYLGSGPSVSSMLAKLCAPPRASPAGCEKTAIEAHAPSVLIPDPADAFTSSRGSLHEMSCRKPEGITARSRIAARGFRDDNNGRSGSWLASGLKPLAMTLRTYSAGPRMSFVAKL